MKLTWPVQAHQLVAIHAPCIQPNGMRCALQPANRIMAENDRLWALPRACPGLAGDRAHACAVRQDAAKVHQVLGDACLHTRTPAVEHIEHIVYAP